MYPEKILFELNIKALYATRHGEKKIQGNYQEIIELINLDPKGPLLAKNGHTALFQAYHPQTPAPLLAIICCSRQARRKEY